MPWSASASQTKFFSNTPSTPERSPNTISLSNTINNESQIRSALQRPNTPTSAAPRTPFFSPQPLSGLQRGAPNVRREARPDPWEHIPRSPLPPGSRPGTPQAPTSRPSTPLAPGSRPGTPRTPDPRLCQFPASPAERRQRLPHSPMPSPAPSPAPHAYSMSQRQVINLDDPPRYDARPPPRHPGMLAPRSAAPPSQPKSASEWPNEKTPSSPYHPRQPPVLPPRPGQVPHTAHPLGSFPRHHSPRDGYRPRNDRDGSMTAAPDRDGKPRGFFDASFDKVKAALTSPLSALSGSNKSPDTPRSARPRDTRRFGYYEYKTPVTGEFEMKGKGEFGGFASAYPAVPPKDMKGDYPYSAKDYPYSAKPDYAAYPKSAVLFDGDVKTPHGERGFEDVTVLAVPDDDKADLEKGLDGSSTKPKGFLGSWRAQFREIRGRFKRPKSGRIPSYDADAEPQSLEQIERTLRETKVMAWTTLGGVWLMQFSTFGYIWTWNVYQDYYMNNHGDVHTRGKLAWIGSLQLTLCFAFGLISGTMLDRGYFYVATMLGSLIFGMGVFVLSFVDPASFFQLFVVQGLFTGSGLGLLFLPSALICMFHFKEKKALMTGIAMSGSAFGAMIYPIMVDKMFEPKGFQGAVRGSSYLVISTLVIANCLIAKPPKVWAPKYPPLDLLGCLKEPSYAAVCVGIFLTTLALYFPQNYIEDYAVQAGVNAEVSFYSVAVLGISALMGRIALGVAAEKLGAWNLLIPSTVMVFIMTCAMTGMRNAGSVVAVCIFYGFFAGAWLSLLITALASLAIRPSETGQRVGLALTASSLGAFLSLPAHAGLLGKDLVFNRAIGLMAVLVLLAVPAFVYVRIVVARKRRFRFV
ncbi:hypothetical protein D9611_009192 [Ephemerocybe angulata]|uniref:Monocarboxylate transporter n=1 Tax=Ephemerocybe angulata TaxID=980116 RepID=A0A8H5FK58_9AGAR|nr:hypothetical protein D9611_009192 [Tulosesus angulatus]